MVRESIWDKTCFYKKESAWSIQLKWGLSTQIIVLNGNEMFYFEMSFCYCKLKVLLWSTSLSRKQDQTWINVFLWAPTLSLFWALQNSGWISLKIDWFHLFAVQETLRSLFHHHSSKASVPQCSASFMIQLSQLFVTLEDYSLDYTDLCQQSNVSAFQHTV